MKISKAIDFDKWKCVMHAACVYVLCVCLFPYLSVFFPEITHYLCLN